eukprot:s2968_g2.t2
MPVPQAPPADHVGGGVNCLDDTFSLVRAELLAQEREIQELQAEISELKANGPIVPRVVQDVADTYKVAVAPEEEEDVVLKPKRASIVDAGDDHKIHVAFYEFDQSMWDAGLLLCFHHTGALDKFLLFIGVILNLALQLAMLLVVEFAMLDNPWTSEQVGEMLKWRVNSGHKQFFPDSGETLSQRLCSRKLWNFQQEVYNEVYDYLSKPVPGVVLSFLAVALWMLTIMMEYRSCVEQALGVWHLPSLKTEDEFEEVTEDGEIVVRGISPCLRCVAIVTLIIPRLFIMTSLAVDIVLNCLALAFVLDVDELVAQVLLTEKLRGLLTKIQPIDCGKTKSVRAPFQDVFRLGLAFAGVGFCVVMILFPFKENVESAAAVLCGGNLDFSYTGGLEIDPHIVLRPMNFGTDQWTPATADCPETDELFYLKKYYLPDLNSTGNRSNTNSTTIVRSSSEWDALKLKHVWNFLLHPETAKCPQGQILAPQVDGEGEEGPPARVCQEFPPALREALDDEKVENAGLGPIVATCIGLDFGWLRLPKAWRNRQGSPSGERQGDTRSRSESQRWRRLKRLRPRSASREAQREVEDEDKDEERDLDRKLSRHVRANRRKDALLTALRLLEGGLQCDPELMVSMLENAATFPGPELFAETLHCCVVAGGLRLTVEEFSKILGLLVFRGAPVPQIRAFLNVALPKAANPVPVIPAGLTDAEADQMFRDERECVVEDDSALLSEDEASRGEDIGFRLALRDDEDRAGPPPSSVVLQRCRYKPELNGRYVLSLELSAPGRPVYQKDAFKEQDRGLLEYFRIELQGKIVVRSRHPALFRRRCELDELGSSAAGCSRFGCGSQALALDSFHHGRGVEVGHGVAGNGFFQQLLLGCLPLVCLHDHFLQPLGEEAFLQIRSQSQPPAT